MSAAPSLFAPSRLAAAPCLLYSCCSWPPSTPLEIKYVLLGATSVGKTSLASRLVYDRFRTTEAPTIGAAFSTKVFSVNAPDEKRRVALSAGAGTRKRLVKAVVWDTAGQEKYHSLTPMYYRNAMCAIICYDITSAESFEEAQRWSDELRLQGPEHCVVCVVGNKSDMEAERQVATSDAKAWSNTVGASFYEVSAKTGSSSCAKIFEESAMRVLRHPLLLQYHAKPNPRRARPETPRDRVLREGKRRWPCFGR